MKITHCISSIDKSTGGPARSSTGLITVLQKNENIENVDLLVLKSNNPIQDKPIINNKGEYKFFSSNFAGFSLELAKELKINKAELFHGHGIWELPIHQMSQIIFNRNLPYIISVRGMLEEWSLKQGLFKKKIATLLYQKKDLKRAACIHATAVSEAQAIRNLGYTNPIAVIPNGIDLFEYPYKNKIDNKKKKILFLSRIHYKKGLELLIEAWSEICEDLKKDWEIEIVGNGEKAYIEKLNNIISSKKLNKQITIKESIFGKEKIEVYHNADLFVLPTYSENFGIVIAEALACGTPVITTKGTPWKDLETYNAGSWIDIGVVPLKDELEKYMNKSEEEYMEMGRNGRRLVEGSYSIESVGQKFTQLYTWVLKKTEKPEFVI